MTDVANATMTMTTSTTQAPFKLTPTNLQNLIRRNLRGLVRLFNIEWQDAMNVSLHYIRFFLPSFLCIYLILLFTNYYLVILL